MNTYKDNPEYRFHLEHNDLMRRIVELREKNYTEAEQYDFAPVDFEDAIDNYDKVLEVVGDINANVIAPNAESVDLEGAHCENGRVRYAEKTAEDLDATMKAGLCGLTMPRQYGGVNLPFSVYTAANEIISSGDAGFENVWSLQDCIETLYCFGTDEQREKYIPLVCNGATMSMDLTEPDAGSDLQSVTLKAHFVSHGENGENGENGGNGENGENGYWVLNGVKRFITNGDSDLHLVLARSEEGTTDGRGLSMFLYDNRKNKAASQQGAGSKEQGAGSKELTVRRIENKLGIHGSPTCELVFRNAKCEIVGDRKLGLIRYVMSLMNGARLGIAAQSVGIQQAAWEEALSYAKERKQYGREIIHFPAVAQMIANIKARLDAGRTLLYECAKYVDLYKILEYTSRERSLTPEERKEMKTYQRLADAFTPLAKGINSEFANRSTYDAIQVHGGSGYMQEYRCQRLYRDARITSIYEGTTQLQVVAALRYITNGTYLSWIREKVQEVQESLTSQLSSLTSQLSTLISQLEETIDFVKAQDNQEVLDLCGRSLYEMTVYTVMALLITRDKALAPDLFGKSHAVFMDLAKSEMARHSAYIHSISAESVDSYKQD